MEERFAFITSTTKLPDLPLTDLLAYSFCPVFPLVQPPFIFSYPKPKYPLSTAHILLDPSPFFHTVIIVRELSFVL